MNHLPLPLTRDVVLIGGGHAHALVLRAWGMDPLPGARLTVINPSATAPYTGMLPGFVAGHYGRDDLEIDLVRLARFAGARMIFGWVTGIDRAAKMVKIDGHAPVAYDIASLDIGITSTMPEIPGFDEHAISAKPLGPYSNRWSSHLEKDAGPVAVIGGGIAGVELALAMRHAMGPKHEVTVIEARSVLEGVGRGSRALLMSEMAAQRITLIENTSVAQIESDHAVLSDGQLVASNLTVGAAGARPFPWLKDTGLDLTHGFVTVDETLTSISDPAIFAVGDCAHSPASPRPKAGVFAVRAAPVLRDNLRARLTGKPLRPFKPQSHYLKLVSLGRKAALADKWNRAVHGNWVWRWKDQIDQTFMNKLDQFPKMERSVLPAQYAEGMATALGAKPLCGGCGSKVGASVLDKVISELPGRSRDDVHLGSGDDAAILGTGDARQVITTDHLRAFWNDPWLFARIAALHALGDIWAMGATPQAALAQITLPPLSPDLQSRWMREIMAAATDVFQSEGAVIAGGHSTMGAELVIGFTVTGLPSGAPLTLSGAKPGDQILLTRPIGSGVLLAAEMESVAPGDKVQNALNIMATSQGDAATCLAARAHAMTDVTGFGLAGHLHRMAEASGLAAEITLSGFPVYDGAEALAANGVRSSIWDENKKAHPIDAPDTARADLLFDPQTAGGLLAALPNDKAPKTLHDIRAMGHDAAIIGHFAPNDGVTLRAK